jgi:glycosyltransferase involved in cell wall biosynthesis
MRMNQGVEVSVVLPCLNEAETIAICITKAQKSFSLLGITGEIVVVDNGSTDSSQKIAQDLNAKVVEVGLKGYGSALLAGFRVARGKYIIMADADDSYSLDNLELFIRDLRNGSDLVMGNRFAGTIHKGAMPWLHRYIGNPLLSFIGRLFFKSEIRDFHCGIRGLNRDKALALNLQTLGMEFASELVVKAILAKYKITEVPTDLKPDGRSRAPHLKTWRDGWRHLRFLLSYSPKWLFFYPGVLLTTLGLIGVAFLMPGQKEVFGVRFDLQTLIYFAFILITGTQLIWFALLSSASSVSKGFLPLETKYESMFRLARNELFYVFYLILVLIGVSIVLHQSYNWISSSFGELNPSQVVRLSLLGGITTFVGFQALISHFLLSIVTMGTDLKPKSNEVYLQ